MLTHVRSYSTAQLGVFDELSGRDDSADSGYLPDLLVIASLTKLGGDLDYLSREMEWEVYRQVHAGETIQAEVEVTALEQRASMLRIALNARIRGSDGELVVHGQSHGVIPAAPPEAVSKDSAEAQTS